MHVEFRAKNIWCRIPFQHINCFLIVGDRGGFLFHKIHDDRAMFCMGSVVLWRRFLAQTIFTHHKFAGASLLIVTGESFGSSTQLKQFFIIFVFLLQMNVTLVGGAFFALLAVLSQKKNFKLKNMLEILNVKYILKW